MKSFSHEQYARLVERTIEQINSLSKLKGGEYAGDNDRLANFRRNGDVLGLPMEIVWAVYYNKHHDAVMQFIQDLNTGKRRDRMEPISGRVDDMIVYLILLKAMLEERENDTPEERRAKFRKYFLNGIEKAMAPAVEVNQETLVEHDVEDITDIIEDVERNW